MADNPPPAKPAKRAKRAKKGAKSNKSSFIDITGSIIDVRVGNRKTFHIHENVLKQSSRFFQNALKPEWSKTEPEDGAHDQEGDIKEPQKRRPIELAKDKLDLFNVYVQWLYSLKPEWSKPEWSKPEPEAGAHDQEGDIKEPQKRRPIELAEDKPDLFNVYVQWLYSENLNIQQSVGSKTSCLAKLYVLGESLFGEVFQNVVIRAFITHLPARHCFPGPYDIDIIYNGTSEHSPARRLLVDAWCWEVSSPQRGIIEMFHVEFKNDLLMALLKRRSLPEPCGDEPWLMNPESYLLGYESVNIQGTGVERSEDKKATEREV